MILHVYVIFQPAEFDYLRVSAILYSWWGMVGQPIISPEKKLNPIKSQVSWFLGEISTGL
jgi:hypothetical protein